jgi:ABC-type amino acid transport substrate-binding protein
MPKSKKPKLKKPLKFLIFIGTCLVSLLVSAGEKKWSVITAPWDRYTNKDGTGLYFDILNSTIGKESYNYKVVPWKRAQDQFQKGRADILMGESGDLKYCQYPKWAIDADFFSAFYLKSKISNLTADLSPFKLLWVRGYELQNFDPKLKAFEEVDDYTQGIKKVMAGRADILLDYDQDLKEYIKIQKLDEKEFMVTPTNISGGKIWLCFGAGEKYNHLAKEFDSKMNQLHKSGDLKKLFLKYNRIKNFEKVLIDTP